MTEEDPYKEAYEAAIGADRMTFGLPCIPDPFRGDLVEIKRLTAERDRLRAALLHIADHKEIHSDFVHNTGNLCRYARRALAEGTTE